MRVVISMERSFLEPEQCEQLKKFAQIMAAHGQMRRFTDDAWILMQMALAGVQEPPPNPLQKYNVLLFSDKDWCYLVVRHTNFLEPEGNGLCALRIKKSYMIEQTHTKGRPDKARMQRMLNGLLSILNVDFHEIEIDKLSLFQIEKNGSGTFWH